MPNHRTSAVLLLPALLAAGACTGSVVAQGCEIVFTLTDLASNGLSASVALGDLDGDGDLDAMVANQNQPNIVWNNDGNGTFTNSGQALGNGISLSVALGDLDGDSDLDAMVANQNQPNTVWTNDVEPIATGACCVTSGCTINTETACTELGGSWTESGSCDDCPTTCSADLNGDGTVDGQDLAALLAAWGLPCDE